MKTILRLVAVAFGALLVGESVYVEYLFRMGLVTLGDVPLIAECALAWLVVLGGVTALLVRRATPTRVTNNYVTNNYGRDDESEESDESDDESEESDEEDND